MKTSACYSALSQAYLPQGKCNVESRLKIFSKYKLLEKMFANLTAS